jgi:glucose-1-phosphate adenylyltransferase
VNNDVLALILGGGQGTRLFPLTQLRSKPAVPIGGNYRLIDIPISNCLHADMRRIFVLTQFNSASLNRHIAQTYRMDLFSRGFVEILAAEQTPDNPNWFQGTADAVRQASRHFARHEATYYLILAGDHLYRMNYCDLVASHADSGADITLAVQPISIEEASAMGIIRFDRSGRIDAFEEKPKRARLEEIGRSVPEGSTLSGHSHSRETPFIASMGIYVFSRQVLLDILAREAATDFGREIIPRALDRYRVNPFLFRGYWADVGTIASFYDANIMLTRPGAPFTFYDPRRPIYTHPRFLTGSRLRECTVRDSIIAEGSHLDRSTIESSIIGIRANIQPGATIRRSVLLGADFYEAPDDSSDGTPRLGIGKDVVLDRVIVDKNARIGDGARLVNEAGADHADGEGYYIRNGVIVVPKDGVIAPGTVA